MYALGVCFNKDPRVQVLGINLASFLKLRLVKVYFFDFMLLRKEVWESRVCGSFPFEDVAIKILDHLIPVMELTLTKQEIFVPRTLKYLGRRNCGVSFVLKRSLGYSCSCVCICVCLYV